MSESNARVLSRITKPTATSLVTHRMFGRGQKSIIIVTDEVMDTKTSILNLDLVAQSETARIGWSWGTDEVITLDASDTWPSTGGLIKNAVKRCLDSDASAKIKLVIFPRDGCLIGTRAKLGAQVDVIFAGCPKMKISTLGLIKTIASWGIWDAHLHYCWSVLPLHRLPPANIADTTRCNALSSS